MKIFLMQWLCVFTIFALCETTVASWEGWALAFLLVVYGHYCAMLERRKGGA
jgi:hypothetical protein